MLFHCVDNVIRAVEAVNSAAEFITGKKWIVEGLAVDPKLLADTAKPINGIV